MVLYASDMDRTLIFSGRFLEEYPTDASYSVIEQKEGKVISYMSDEVYRKLDKVRRNSNVTFVPVTTRSLEEYNRINLRFTPEYAIVSNGGIILHNGEPIKEWEEYIKKNIDMMEAMELIHDIQDNLSSVNYKIKVIDSCYLFFKTNYPELFDVETQYLIEKYPNWVFTRQNKKCYAIPKHFSKQVALRWLWHKLNEPFIVASGDSELDLPMLTLANRAIIPSHGSLVKDKFVLSGTFADGGITSPLFTMKVVEEEANK